MEDQDDFARLAELYTGISHEARIAILYGLAEGTSMTVIADELGVTRGTLQNHVERMISSELVYRPSDSGESYALTPLGRSLLRFVEEERSDLVTALSILEDAESEVRDQFDASELPLDERTVEKTIHTEKWEQVEEEIAGLLENE